MMALLTGLLSAGSGGIFGGIMAIGTSFMKARAAKADHERMMEMKLFDLKAVASGHFDKMEELKQLSSSSGLIASISADKMVGISPWAANLKTLFRPFLTTILIGIAVYIFTVLLSAYRGQANLASELFDAQMISDLLRYAVTSLIFAATTSVSWWFGERALTPPRSK